MSHRSILDRGFTLVELMIVVAIVGVLSMLAVYGIRKYVANAKTAEARSSLGQMGKNAVAAYERETMSDPVLAAGATTAVVRHVCATGTTAFIPGGATATPPASRKYQSSKADWHDPRDEAGQAGFPCLRFEVTAPQYFAYGYAGSGTDTGSFTATANGDLNGDGFASTFTLLGTVQSGRLTVAPTLGEVSPED